MQPQLIRSSALPKGAWKAVVLLWFAFALNYIDRQLAYSVFPALRQDLGFTQIQLGLIGTLFLWTYGGAMPLTGRAADRFDRRMLILASVVLWSLATALSGLSTSAPMFLALRAVIGLSEALYFPAALGMVATLHTGTTRSTALAVHQSAQLAGIIAGGSYGGWAAENIGWRYGFLAVAIAGLMYVVLLWFTLPRTPEVHIEQASGGSLGELVRSKCYVSLALAFCAFCAMLWILYAWLPNFLYERHHLTMQASGVIATAYMQISSAVGLLGGGALADWMVIRIPAARFYIASAGLVLSPAFCFAVFNAATVNALEWCLIGFGLTAGLMQSSVFAAAYDVVPVRSYGIAAGSLNVFGSMGGGISVLLVGASGAGGIAVIAGYTGLLTVVTGTALCAIAVRSFRKETLGYSAAARGT